MKLSLARICLIGFLVLELILGIGTWLTYRADTSSRSAQPADDGTARVKSRILELTDGLRGMALHIANHPQTLASFSNGPEAARLTQLANIHAFYPDVKVLLLPADSQSAAIYAGSPLSAVHARLLEAIGKNPDNSAVAAANLSLTTVQPVADGERNLRGYVVVDKELPGLQKILDTPPSIDSYMELQQSAAGGAYSVLMQHGNENLKVAAPKQTIELPGTAWRLAVWPAAPVAVAKPGQSYVIGWLLASLLAAVLTGSLYLALRRALQDDLRAMLTLLADIRHNRLRKDYPLKLQDISQTFNLMIGLGKLMVGKQKQVANFASLDHLSQVHNRRSFEAKQQELFKTLAQGWVHSLLILDIDNFKQVNDTFGHDAGDALIVQFGKILKDSLRSSDFIARLGGDEFCVIFPNTPLKRATELAERLRENMPKQVELTHGVMHRLGWSGGLSEYCRTDASENMALARADSALLEAKRTGRNRTSLKAAA